MEVVGGVGVVLKLTKVDFLYSTIHIFAFFCLCFSFLFFPSAFVFLLLCDKCREREKNLSNFSNHFPRFKNLAVCHTTLLRKRQKMENSLFFCDNFCQNSTSKGITVKVVWDIWHNKVKQFQPKTKMAKIQMVPIQ